ncbi:hypothetical protein OH76DRAFT_1407231 [Lentinus brumalis]|uniref:Secreted protein n=1 Tax=Lentinus brumalis TaxID=2498619 RepID=A0A371D0N2_9APHY|nr:hypothetical protein OH76DRAFT_1407231 [Polyporus brumalis]
MTSSPHRIELAVFAAHMILRFICASGKVTGASQLKTPLAKLTGNPAASSRRLTCKYHFCAPSKLDVWLQHRQCAFSYMSRIYSIVVATSAALERPLPSISTQFAASSGLTHSLLAPTPLPHRVDVDDASMHASYT